MASRYSAENLKICKLVQEIEPISQSGTRDTEFEVVLDDAPAADIGWIVVNYNIATKRDLIHYHRRDGNTLYYYRSQRDLFNIGAYGVYHEVNTSVRVHDVAEFINHMYENTSDLGYVKKYGPTAVEIFGGDMLNITTGVRHTIADTTYDSFTDATHYIYINLSDFSINKSTTAPTAGMWHIATIVVSASVITSITDTRAIIVKDDPDLSSYLTSVDISDINAGGTADATTFLRGDGNRTTILNGSGTINELTYWVDTQTIGTLPTGTYPNLGELAYLKGVTSAIQTQLNAKEPTKGSDDNYVTDAQLALIAATTASFTTTHKSKLDNITVTQAVDLDQMEADIAALANGMVYKGDWDASAGSFPGAGVAQAGWFYTVSVGGTVDSVVFNVGDRLIAKTDNASATTYTGNWTQLDATDAVTSVHGRTGNVVSANGDYTASQITNVAAGGIAAITVQDALNELDTDKQNANVNLTTIAGLSPSNDDILQRKSGAWINRTMTQLKSDLSLNNVENTALSTWAGTNNITTLGTVTTGTWNATAIGLTKGGTGVTSISALSIWAANSANTLVELTPAAGQSIRINAGGTAWEAYTPGTGGGGGTWGSITGTLSDQTDLQAVLDAKVDENSAITPATKTKITYDAKGLVTGGADATTADIADSSNKRYVTDAELAILTASTASFTTAQATKLGHITVTQTVDLDQMESDIAALANGMVYKGDRDASAGTFPGAGVAQAGWFYTVSVAGTVDSVVFNIGDRLIAKVDNASATTYAANWTMLDATDAVTSVNGQVGNVTLNADHIDDTSTTHKFVTATDLTKLSNLSGTNSGDQTLQQVFDAGTTITIANTDNQTLTINQNDTTNNPTGLQVTNLGTGAGIRVDQTGVGTGIRVDNASTQRAISINQNANFAAGREALLIYSNTALTTGNGLQYLYIDHASSTIPVLKLRNDGSGDLLLGDAGGTTVFTVTAAGAINLGHATDTTISRVSAGKIAVEGVNVVTTSSTDTLTNKTITKRVTTITSSGTPTINTDNCDCVTITALAEAITSMTTNLSGTPTDFQSLIIRIKDNGTARAITWGASFEAKGVALPTTTVISKVLTVGFLYDTVTSKRGCIASAQEA